MKIIRISIFSMIFISPILYAKTTSEYFSEAKQGICKSLIEKEGERAVYDCASIMANDSEDKLTKRVTEMKNTLKGINDKKIISAFLKEQKALENYRRDRCDYITSGTTYGSNAYQFNYSICQAVENYRRVETLVGEPGFP